MGYDINICSGVQKGRPEYIEDHIYLSYNWNKLANLCFNCIKIDKKDCNCEKIKVWSLRDNLHGRSGKMVEEKAKEALVLLKENGFVPVPHDGCPLNPRRSLTVHDSNWYFGVGITGVVLDDIATRIGIFATILSEIAICASIYPTLIFWSDGCPNKLIMDDGTTIESEEEVPRKGALTKSAIKEN